MLIVAGGNVGIGTNNPASILDIGRNQTTPALMIVNNQYAGSYGSVWGLQSGAQSIMIFGNNGQNEIRAGNTATGGIKIDNYYYANGVSISFAGTYSNSNVAAYLPTYTGNITANNITATGNVTAANFVGSGAGTPPLS